jgi:hypothetical protein
MERVTQGFVGACILSLVMVAVASGQEVKVRLRDGSARGFLVLRSETGAILASGEFSQIPISKTAHWTKKLPSTHKSQLFV